MDDGILGPIDFLAIEFPDTRISGGAFELLMQLVQRGIIEVLDLEFVARSADGTVRKVALDSIEHDSDVDITLWRAAESGLLDASDLATVAADLQPGRVAAIVVYENIWAVPLLTTIERSQARVISAARIDADDVIAALGGAPA
jgi:hypothetical protein